MMIIDAHAHISDTSYGNIEIYLQQLQESKIDQGVVVPGGMMDVRRMTDYVIGRSKPENPEPNNEYVRQCCDRYSTQIAGFICLNPHDPSAPEQLEKAFKQGFRGLKLSPMSHEFSFGSKIVADLAACCGEYAYPVYSHVVFSPGASTARFVALARQFPKTCFIAGHMGFGPADQEGLEAAATLDNFFLETSTGNFLHIKETYQKAGAGKLIFGSEFPLSHPGVELQKILWLKLTDQDRDRILGENIKTLLRLTVKPDKTGKTDMKDSTDKPDQTAKPDQSQNTLGALNQLVDHCRNASFYKDRLPAKPLRTLDDFCRIPLTTKEDLRSNSPFGLLCVERNRLFQYHESFGTTGVPVSIWLTRKDVQANVRKLMRWGVNFHPGDVVMVRFPYAISMIAHMVTAAAQRQGACVIPVSSRSMVSPFSRVVKMLKNLKVTVLAGLPLQALLIAETAEMMGLQPKEDFPDLRAICTAGELLSPGRRRILEDIWGVPVFDNYGMTEIGAAVVDCEFKHAHPEKSGLYFEILREDRKTLAPLGETGLLVVTTLGYEGTPLIRYLTGDRARLIQAECPCGSPVALEVRGRVNDGVAVGDRWLDLWEIQEIISCLPCRRFWVAGSNENGLNVVVEEEAVGQQVTEKEVSQLEKKFKLKLSVTVVPKGTLYDREELLSVGTVGKPQYIFTPQEMAERKYEKSVRV